MNNVVDKLLKDGCPPRWKSNNNALCMHPKGFLIDCVECWSEYLTERDTTANEIFEILENNI